MNSTERRNLITDYFSGDKFVINPENLYKPRDSDLICIGPPKSGTTWMQQILHQIRTKGDMSFDDIYGVTTYICHPDNQHYDVNKEQVCNPRVFKHHELYGVIQNTKKQKQIFICRNPSDAVYSWSKYLDRFNGSDADVSDHDMAEFITTNHDLNKVTNFKCIASWWAHKNDANVLFVFYEDLVRDLKGMIKKVSNFVELPLTENELNVVVNNCTFECMTKNKQKFQGETVVLAIATVTGMKTWKPNLGMIREDGGKIGEGVRKIGPELSVTVARLWSETVEKEFGFKTYQEMYEKNSCLV